MDPTAQGSSVAGSGAAPSKRREMATFLATTFVLIPGLAVAFVGGYGFVVWALQMIFGPPGPPG
ncbi:MAG: reductase [Rhodospirillales bacterium]|nr:reductase [Rhodospirillales bacterium]MBO6786591.1 reductase [Rhodospirillales bacterium]